MLSGSDLGSGLLGGPGGWDVRRCPRVGGRMRQSTPLRSLNTAGQTDTLTQPHTSPREGCTRHPEHTRPGPQSRTGCPQRRTRLSAQPWRHCRRPSAECVSGWPGHVEGTPPGPHAPGVAEAGGSSRVGQEEQRRCWDAVTGTGCFRLGPPTCASQRPAEAGVAFLAARWRGRHFPPGPAPACEPAGSLGAEFPTLYPSTGVVSAVSGSAPPLFLQSRRRLEL